MFVRNLLNVKPFECFSFFWVGFDFGMCQEHIKEVTWDNTITLNDFVLSMFLNLIDPYLIRLQTSKIIIFASLQRYVRSAARQSRKISVPKCHQNRTRKRSREKSPYHNIYHKGEGNRVDMQNFGEFWRRTFRRKGARGKINTKKEPPTYMDQTQRNKKHNCM